MSVEHTDTEQRPPRHDAIAAVAHAGPLAFLGAIVGGIAGWLLSAGAVPRPSFLPPPPGASLEGALLFAALGLLGGAILGSIAYLADRTQEQGVEPPRATTPE
jgi:hypothetical protein